MDADVGVRLEVDAVVLLQRIRRGRSPSPRGRGLPGGGGGWGSSGEARAAPREGGVAVEVRRQHGGLVVARGIRVEISERNVLYSPQRLGSLRRTLICLPRWFCISTNCITS